MELTEKYHAIENADVVVWYRFSHTYIPGQEDYLVMPAASIGFTLKPNGVLPRTQHLMFLLPARFVAD